MLPSSVGVVRPYIEMNGTEIGRNAKVYVQNDNQLKNTHTIGFLFDGHTKKEFPGPFHSIPLIVLIQLPFCSPGCFKERVAYQFMCTNLKTCQTECINTCYKLVFLRRKGSSSGFLSPINLLTQLHISSFLVVWWQNFSEKSIRY